MIICGLDIATTTGLAIFEGERFVHAEAFRPAGKTDAEIFHGFRVWLRSSLIGYGVQACANEETLRSDIKRTETDQVTGATRQVSMVSKDALERIYGLRAHAAEICYALNIPHFEVNQSTWRSSFLRDGKKGFDNWKKAAMAQCQLLRWPVPKHDAAEACGVAWWLGGHLKTMTHIRPGDLFYDMSRGAA